MRARIIFTLVLVILVSVGVGIDVKNGYALTIENTVTWSTEPAGVESYFPEKQTNGGAWTALPTLPAGTMQFVDSGNAPGATVCYRVTPQNTLPSTGTPSQVCSTTTEPVGDMPSLNLNYRVVP